MPVVSRLLPPLENPRPLSAKTGASAWRRLRHQLAAPFWATRTQYERFLQARESHDADRRHNAGLTATHGRILVVRHQHEGRGYNAPFLGWVGKGAPELASRLELRRLPCRIDDWSRYSLLVPWLQDPLRESNPIEYERARHLEEQAKAHGIPIVNAVDRASVSIKSRAARIMRDAGVNVPSVVRIDEPVTFRRSPPLPMPFFIREDLGHGGPMVLIRTRDDLDGAPIESMRAPIAVEFVDVRGSDGNYRKYRYVLFGKRGVPRHLLISKNWVVHAADRLVTDETRDEELRYLGVIRDPNHHVLARALKALDLDTAAFDYAYDQTGRLVVFEVNPFPWLWARVNDEPQFSYLAGCRERLFSELSRYLIERGDDVRLPGDFRSTRRAV